VGTTEEREYPKEIMFAHYVKHGRIDVVWVLVDH
jgi:hypothetical protein